MPIVVLLGAGLGVAVAGTPTSPVGPALSEVKPGSDSTTSLAQDPLGGSTTSAAPTSVSPTTTTLPPVRDRSEVRVVVANASRRPGVAGQYAEVVRFLGYVDVVATDALDTARATRVFYAPGLAREAERLVEDLDLGEVTVAPVPTDPVIPPELSGDVVVLVGLDKVS